jgi:hypothetical protein
MIDDVISDADIDDQFIGAMKKSMVRRNDDSMMTSMLTSSIIDGTD